MKSNPLITAIIPTFNRSSVIINALNSVLKQSYNPIEIIIIDDGSNDNTFNKTYSLLKKNNVRYIYQPNKGVSSARNIGIQNANGEFIAFLDSDDLWHKNKLELQMNFLLNQSEYNICYTNEIWIRNGIKVNQKKKHAKYSGNIYINCLKLCIISPSSIIMKREVINDIGLFDESLPACEDYDYWLRLSAKYPIHFIDKPLITKYGGHSDQLSKKYIAMDSYRVKSMLKMINNTNLNPKNRNETIKTILEKSKILINGYHKRGNIKKTNYYQNIINKYQSPY